MCHRLDTARQEGDEFADWRMPDLGDVIVHVMQKKAVRLYELESSGVKK